jgi:O-antigen ligase
MNDPVLFSGFVLLAVCAMLLATVGALVRPHQALASGFFIVLLAGLKFRERDAAASLSDSLDLQVAYELAWYAILAIILCVNLLFRRDRPSVLSPALWLVGYVFLAVVSVLWSLAPALTAVRALQLLILVGLALMSVDVFGPARTLQKASASLLLFLLFCAASTVFVNPIQDEGRFTWAGVHPITAATYLGLASILFLARGLYPKQRASPTRDWFVFGLFVTILVLTFSRGPLFAFVASGAVLLYKRVSSARARTLLAVASAMIVLTVASGDFVEQVVVRAAGSDSAVVQSLLREQNPEQFLSMTGRVELWTALVPVIAGQPLLGYGYQGSRELLLNIADWAAYAHNAFLQTLVDVGFLGAVLLFVPVFWAAGRALYVSPSRSSDPTEVAGALGIVVFFLVVGISSETFAGAPGFEMLLLMVVVKSQQNWKAAESQGPTPAAERAISQPSMAVGRGSLA